MPTLLLKTSAPAPDQAAANALLLDISGRVAKHLGKPESYVMVSLESGVSMSFGGNLDAPVAFMSLKSVGKMTAATTSAISADLCALVQEKLGVPQERVYIEFCDSPGYMFGWNGTTFG
ncbi:macrophage migration inhibitory factor [Tribonema minus]|uniref:L-dopachrome isomerase n=1 Tax=Tribonema minus TaxID=303371 RepID=A0A835ZD38_9STRA|nr:macrophage migration inhibitory factor [Tribonema minus]